MVSLLLASTLGAALAAAPPMAVPFRRSESGHVVIDVAVEGGGTVPFVVDTGASVTAVSPEAWAAAGGDPDRGFLVRGRGAGGVVEGVRVVPDVDLLVAGHPVAVGAAVVMPLPSLGPDEGPLAGLLGRDVLRRHVVEIDDATSILTLHPAGTVVDPGPDAMVLPMRRVRGGLTVVRVEIGGDRADAVLDIGAAVTVLNGPARRLDGVAAGEGCGGEILGADGRTQTVDCVLLGSFRLGGHELGPIAVTAADLDIFAVLRLARRPALFLGNDVFTGRRMILDDGRRTVTLGAVRTLED